MMAKPVPAACATEGELLLLVPLPSDPKGLVSGENGLFGIGPPENGLPGAVPPAEPPALPPGIGPLGPVPGGIPSPGPPGKLGGLKPGNEPLPFVPPGMPFGNGFVTPGPVTMSNFAPQSLQLVGVSFAPIAKVP
jgi:hypothetical protein